MLAVTPPADRLGAPIPNVVGYRVYRSPAAGGVSGDEVLLASPAVPPAGGTESRYLMGSAVQSAFIFLVGGQTGTSAAASSTELVIW